MQQDIKFNKIGYQCEAELLIIQQIFQTRVSKGLSGPNYTPNWENVGQSSALPMHIYVADLLLQRLKGKGN